MAPRIDSKPNLPTTDPLWVDQRLVDGKDLTPDEVKTSKEQTQALGNVLTSLKQPVQKGDIKAAKARVDSLQKEFESLSPENKKYMYETLQTNNGIAKEFHYRLSSTSRDKLLKSLNPEHKQDAIKKYTLDDAKQKAHKNLELNMQGTSQQQELERMMKKKEQLNKEIMENLAR